MPLYVEDSTAPRTRDKRLDEALKRWKLAEEADDKQRTAELEDLKFVDDPDGQWPAELLKARSSATIGNLAIPPRPTLTIDKLSPSIDQVTNAANNARLSIKVKPKGSRASQQTAEIIQGLYRNIEVESKAHRARIWALDRAAKCGRGYYRVLTQYSNDGDFDLDIVIARILNQHSVRIDPFHKEPDGSDAEWALIGEDVLWDARFREKYPKSRYAHSSVDDQELVGLGDEVPGWIGGDADRRTIRIAEYFYVEHETRTLIATEFGWKGFADDPAKPPNVGRIVASRDVQIRKVKWCLITGHDILDEREWNGRYIPIVQVIGKETNINGERRYRGMVQKAKGSQQRYNVMMSREMEVIGLSSTAPYKVVEGVLEGYEQMWIDSIHKNLPFVYHKQTDLQGRPAPAPQRDVAEPPIQAISLAIQQASQDIQATTQTFDPSLGRAQSRTQSGRAIAELQQQSEQGNSNYLENLAQDSMAHEARIVIDLMKSVYDRPGRIAQILGEDDEPSEVMLNAPFVMQEGHPQMAAEGQAHVQRYDLTDGEYSVTVSIGKSFSTMREESNAMMGQLSSAAPQLMPFIADLWVRSMDFPGKDEIADRLKKMLPPPLQEQPEGQQPDPMQLQAQNAQLMQQLQQMGLELQKAQAGLDKEQLKAESKEKIEAAKLATQLEVEEIKANVKRLEAMIRAQIEGAKVDSAETRAAMQLADKDAQRRADLHTASLQAQTTARRGDGEAP